MRKSLIRIKEAFEKFFTIAGVIAIIFLVGWLFYGSPPEANELPEDLTTEEVNEIVETEEKFDVEEILVEKPDFEHNSNQTFLISVRGCIHYIENTTTDILPVNHELLLAQAALESGWGTSRFAKEGKNLFGIRTYDLREPHMLPSNNPKKWGVKVYSHECDSVLHYMNILNNGTAFGDYQNLRDTIGVDDPFPLVETLDAYASDKNYFGKVRSIIRKIQKEYN